MSSAGLGLNFSYGEVAVLPAITTPLESTGQAPQQYAETMKAALGGESINSPPTSRQISRNSSAPRVVRGHFIFSVLIPYFLLPTLLPAPKGKQNYNFDVFGSPA